VSTLNPAQGATLNDELYPLHQEIRPDSRSPSAYYARQEGASTQDAFSLGRRLLTSSRDCTLGGGTGSCDACCVAGLQAGIVVLGGPSIRRDDVTRPASLPGIRAELVFAYLAVEHSRQVTREELATALWPELLPDSWAAALRGVVSDVRRFLDESGLSGSELIAGARGGYQLRLPPGVTVDIDDARKGLTDARAGLERGDSLAAASAASRVATLTGFPFLPRHGGEWVEQIREELDAIHTAALELAARAQAAAGDARAARAAAERLVRIEPYRESAHQLLIEVLGNAGDGAGALGAFERCRTVLRSELGLDPSSETEAVLRRALAHHPAPKPPRRHDVIADEPKPTRAEPSEQVHETGPLGQYAVLVVEDHAFQRRTASALLRRLGVGSVLEAGDGSAALELLAEVAPPDVIICDIDMPAMDGVEFIRHVARRRLANAVVIASGLDRGMLDAVRAVAEGYGLQVLGAVEKPLTARVLTGLLAMYQPVARRHELDGVRRLSAAEIAEGLDQGWIVGQLAPIADLSTGRIVAAEVVPRWHDPQSASAEAANFTASLATADMIARFSDRLVELGSDAATELAQSGLALEVAMRLPHARLADAELADRLAALVRSGGGDPRQIVLTVGAPALPGGAAVALDVLARLRLKGFGLWLDEAGSATRLDQIPLTGVRLAPSLIRGGASHASDPQSALSLQETVDNARSRQLITVGMGCGTPGEFELLLEVGASHAQGTFLAAPMPARELAEVAPRWTPPTSLAGDVP
jgi:DNA-binding SARP family transcriptional activator/EAL domain-containing protein (putative c-di-GMP-specific phosphodiesterase class I)/AmiR/NasT family two-component response regulator